MSRVLPILFNTDMVQAILNGRKTVTRRVIMPKGRKTAKEKGYCQGKGLWVNPSVENGDAEGHIKDYSILPLWMRYGYYIEHYAPYRPGDTLYVRETWNYVYDIDDSDHIIEDTGRYVYYADDDMPFNYWVDPDGGYKDRMPWKPSIHMPKQAARIWLEVTDVRVERLQDMNTGDFLAEGVVIRPEAYNDPENVCQQARKGFIDIWDSTVKKSEIDQYGWDANPWVWVIEFERCGKPEN